MPCSLRRWSVQMSVGTACAGWTWWPCRSSSLDRRTRFFGRFGPMFLVPLGEWLLQNHLNRFIADLVDEHLDVSASNADYAEGAAPPFDLRLMVRVLLMAILSGQRRRPLPCRCTAHCPAEPRCHNNFRTGPAGGAKAGAIHRLSRPIKPMSVAAERLA